MGCRTLKIGPLHFMVGYHTSWPNLSIVLPVQRYASMGICYGTFVCLCHTCFVSKWLNILSNFFYHLIAPIILVFCHGGSLLNSDGFTPNVGAEYRGVEVRKLGDFFYQYLRNGARYGHSCYRSRIGKHTQPIEWWHF